MTQTQRVLEAFKKNKALTTVQLHNLGFLTNFRARVSDLRKLGHVITCKRIKGKDQSLFTYCGQSAMFEDTRAPQWVAIGNGYEVLEYAHA